MDLSNQRHEAELQSLKSLLQKEANSAADDQANLEREKQALQSALHKEKTERTAEVAQLKTTHASEIKNLDESRKQVRTRLLILKELICSIIHALLISIMMMMMMVIIGTGSL